MTGICLPNETWYADVRVQNYVLDNYEGILFAGKRQGFEFWLANRDKLKKSMTLNGCYKETYKDLTPYIDEPISTPHEGEKEWELTSNKYSDTVIGELTKKSLKRIKCNVTYTAYRDLLFEIFGLRIYKFWGNQLKTWKWMEKEFGGFSSQHKSWNKQFYEVTTLSRFNIVWINFNQMNDKKLFEWAKMNGKDVWIYVEDYLTVEQFLTKISLKIMMIK